MKHEPEIEAWSRYWAANRLDSCISGQAIEDEADINALWASFVQDTPDNSRLIDLAAGNGAVSIRLLTQAQAHGKTLAVDAVDQAIIDPARHLKNHSAIAAQIMFHAETDISALPFKEATFDGAVSQFGFEYAPQKAAAKEMLRILKPGAHFQLLIHHANSALVAPNVQKITYITGLLAKGGPVEAAHTYLTSPPDKQAAALEALEQIGQQTLAAYSAQPPAIIQEIFSAISQLVQRSDLRFSVRAKAAVDMEGRLRAEAERMRQLAAAALDADQIRSLGDRLSQAGATELAITELYIGTDKALLGWLVCGKK